MELYLQVRIKEQTEHGEYNDCLYFPVDKVTDLEKWITENEKQIKEQATARVNNWKSVVSNPPVYVEPTKEELEKLKAERVKEVDELDKLITAKL